MAGIQKVFQSLFKTLSCATDLNASKGNKLFKEKKGTALIFTF